MFSHLCWSCLLFPPSLRSSLKADIVPSLSSSFFFFVRLIWLLSSAESPPCSNRFVSYFYDVVSWDCLSVCLSDRLMRDPSRLRIHFGQLQPPKSTTTAPANQLASQLIIKRNPRPDDNPNHDLDVSSHGTTTLTTTQLVNWIVRITNIIVMIHRLLHVDRSKSNDRQNFTQTQ